jgi:hypothetical protein
MKYEVKPALVAPGKVFLESATVIDPEIEHGPVGKAEDAGTAIEAIEESLGDAGAFVAHIEFRYSDGSSLVYRGPCANIRGTIFDRLAALNLPRNKAIRYGILESANTRIIVGKRGMEEIKRRNPTIAGLVSEKVLNGGILQTIMEEVAEGLEVAHGEISDGGAMKGETEEATRAALRHINQCTEFVNATTDEVIRRGL